MRTSPYKSQKASTETFQYTANFDFVPFIVRFLQGEKFKQAHHTLPIGKPESLTLETIERFREVLNRATFSYLCQQTGWQRSLFLQAHKEHPQQGRLWDAPNWQDLSLSFSEQSLELALAIFNISRRPPGAQTTKKIKSKDADPKEQDTIKQQLRVQNKHIKASQKHLPTLAPERNGDLLFHHIAFCRLVETKLSGKCKSEDFANNPLNIITHFHRFDTITDEHGASFERLLAKDMTPLLPWLGLDWARQWVLTETERWNGGLEQFHHYNQNMSTMLKHWLALVVGKEETHCHLLVPLVRYYERLFEKYEQTQPWVEQFQLMVRNLRIMERQDYSRTWIETWTPALYLKRAYDEATTNHPVEREPAQRLFMECYQHSSFKQALEKIHELTEILQPKVG